MRALIKALDFVLVRCLGLLMLALVGAVLWQVFTRYVLAAPSSWTEELARFLLIWVSLLGAVHAFRNGMHLGLDVLAARTRGSIAKWLNILILAAVTFFSLAVLVLGGTGLVLLTWELSQSSAALGLPMALVYMVAPLAGLLICVYALAAMRETLAGRPPDSAALEADR